MATINTTDPKPGFVYDLDTDTWFPLLGLATQSLDELTDVVITTPSTGQILAYNGTDWINQTETGDISAVSSGTGITVTNGTGPIPSIAIDTTVTVDLSTAQTLTNKTLTSPVINDSITNYSTFKAPTETANIVSSAATGTINIDAETSAVWYYTSNATGNHTLNFRYNSGTTLDSKMSIGETITFVWINTNGATPYYPSAITIDGASVTPKYSGGTAYSAGNASSIDMYQFSIMKTSAAPAYTVFAAQVKYA